jgi:hypothetical protein
MYDWEELKVSQIIDSIITDSLWHWRADDECEIVVTDDIMSHRICGGCVSERNV